MQRTINSPAAHAQCGDTIMQWADELARHSDTPDMLARTYLTPAHAAAATQLTQWMREAGMHVRRDMAGNVIGRYEGLTANAPALLTGSHFDTVRNAGKYDGNLGILLAIACIRHWRAHGIRFPFAIEVIGFAEEEGVRFKATLLGSRAAAGTFDMAVLDNRDEHGQSMREVMMQCGLDPDRIAQAAYQRDKVLGFVEVHIEQGPVLLDEKKPLGIVTAIAGASRFVVDVEGQAGHAGTVPMPLRRDAVMASADICLYIEQRCSKIPGLVGTVGQFDVPNSAVNVVPGKARFSIDIRAEDDAVRAAAVADVLAVIDRVAATRNVTIRVHKVHEAASVPCASGLQARLAAALERCGQPVRHLPSGAGHDAMAMAALTDVAMLFVRCGNEGISHHPDETMTREDAALGSQVFIDFIEHFAAFAPLAQHTETI